MNLKIAIDPGHGGSDSGAVGPSGLKESVINLEVAHLLDVLLSASGNSTLLTREEEIAVELGARTTRANDWGADVFCSIHCNSNGPSAHGVEVLYKSEEGLAWAKPVQHELVKATGERDRGCVHRTNLFVLNMSRMPSILVEIGFISNPETEVRLSDHSYRATIARAIHDGLCQQQTKLNVLP